MAESQAQFCSSLSKKNPKTKKAQKTKQNKMTNLKSLSVVLKYFTKKKKLIDCNMVYFLFFQDYYKEKTSYLPMKPTVARPGFKIIQVTLQTNK